MGGKRVVFWRHGQTEWNAQHRFQGQSDVELDAEGLRQTVTSAERVAQLEPTAIVSSDLIRARVTADALAARTGLPVVEDPRLRETSGGSWEGLSRAEIEALQPGALAAWAAGSDLRPGGGERRSEVALRMIAAVNDALNALPNGSVLVVVSHGGSSRAAMATMLELPVCHWGIFGVLANCGWCVLAETFGMPERIGNLAASASEEFPDVPPLPDWRLIEYNRAISGQARPKP